MSCSSAVGQLFISFSSAVGQLLVSYSSTVHQLFICCWSAVHLLLVSCWSAVGQLLVSCWSAVGKLLVSCWSAVDQLLVNCSSAVHLLRCVYFAESLSLCFPSKCSIQSDLGFYLLSCLQQMIYLIYIYVEITLRIYFFLIGPNVILPTFFYAIHLYKKSVFLILILGSKEVFWFSLGNCLKNK